MYELIFFALIIILFIFIVYRKQEKLISGGPPELIMYYKESCPFYQAFKPEWDKAVAMNSGCAVIYSVDIEKNPEFPQDRGTMLQTIPAVYMYPFGRYNSFEEYKGDRKADVMLKWLYRRLNFMGVCGQELL